MFTPRTRTICWAGWRSRRRDAACGRPPRSARARTGKYDPKAAAQGRPGGEEQLRQLPRRAGRDARADGREGAGRDHAYVADVPRPGAAGLGEERLGQPSGDAAAHLLGRQQAARASKRRSATSSRTASASASEVISLPVIVEDGDSYNCFWHMPFRKSARVEIVNQSEKPISLLYYNIDWIKKDRLPKDTPYFYAQYRQEYPVEQRQGLRAAGYEGQGALRRARCWRCARAAPPGSARATRRSTSTARRSRRSGAPARRTTSSPPGD